MRYVELDNITKNDIWVHSIKNSTHYSAFEFNKTCMDGENINILMVNPLFERERIESDILVFQGSQVQGKINLYSGLSLGFGALTALGSLIAGNGIIQLCLNCKPKVVSTDVQVMEEQVFNVDEGRGYHLVYEDRQVTKQVKSLVCEKCKRPTALFILGITIVSSSVTITAVSWYMKYLNDLEKNNLDNY